MKSIITLILFFLFLAQADLTAQFANHIVISEIYGGGGNSGAIFRNDYVELYNPTTDNINISGWSVQYASGSGSTWTVNAVGESVFIAPHTFFLVRLASGGANGDTLPTADAIGTSNLSATTGKIALVHTITPLSGINPTDTTMIDYIGYGSTAGGYEGSGPAPGGSSTTSLERKAQSISSSETMKEGGSDEFMGNGWDSNNNNNDILQCSGPQPQNSLSMTEYPPSDNQPPIISSVTRRTFVPLLGTSDTILAMITDDGNIQSASLHIRVNGGAFDSSVFFSILSGTTYQAIIPYGKHTANGNLVEYFISATDDSSAYSSTANTLNGYFVGESPIFIIKSYSPLSVNHYSARVSGTLNSQTNLFLSNTGYIQDSSGGIQLRADAMPHLEEGRNAKVEGTILDYNGGFALTNPDFSFVDTSIGTAAIVPVIATLPMIHSPSNANEGRLVEIKSLVTDSVGNYIEGKRYKFKNPANDTVTVKVESNGPANSLVGKPISDSSVNAIGILIYNNTFLELKPRSSVDMGIEEGDGTGTASITPTNRLINMSSVSETLTVTGDGIFALEGVSVSVPSEWIWSGDVNDVSISGTGYSGAVKAVHGDGSTDNPWFITITGASITGAGVGTAIINNLQTPSSAGLTVFGIKTRVLSGVFSNIDVSPIVMISENIFEAITSGYWNSASTWSGGVIPGAADNITFTTPDVIVTIVENASCRDLVMRGVDTSGGHLGPVLQFGSGSMMLTVNGQLELSGGVGGGGGNRGGRPQLTSNGNDDALLIILGNVHTNVSNTVDRGNAGINMNEGTVRFIGGTNDTLRNGAGLRLANLIIGDGTLKKSVIWISTAAATLYVRSLTIKNGSKLSCGGTAYSTTNALGNSSSAGIPMFTGGITVESGASLTINNASGGYNSASLNLKDGGIINNGTINLRSPDGSRSYAVSFGEFNVDPSGSKQTIAGTSVGVYDLVKVGSHDTIVINRNMQIIDTLFLKGELVETDGNTIIGTISTSRFLAQNVENTCGGIGVTLNAVGAAPESTIIFRTTGLAQVGSGNRSILRYFDIVPKINSNMNATIIFRYDTSEVNGQDASSLGLWRSTDHGISWRYTGGDVNVAERRITVNEIPSFSRWTAADEAHPLESSGQSYHVDPNWNMVSVPLIVPDYRKSVLYPVAVSDAFMYNGLYEAKDILSNGTGYWLKFAQKETILFAGIEYLSDTIDVAEGWNMIGGPSRPIPTVMMEDIPPGIIESQVFGYSGTYISVDTIFPGKAYWLKTTSSGQIIMNSELENWYTTVEQNPVDPPFHKLIVSDSRGFSGKLYFGSTSKSEYCLPAYDLPPVPPEECYDVRFKSNRNLEVFDGTSDNKERTIDILIQGAVYPVTLRWKMKEEMFGSYSLLGSDKFNIKFNGDGEYVMDKDRKIALLFRNGQESPAFLSMDQNYPNPFNPTTKVSFVIGSTGSSFGKLFYVTLKVYDVLGREVAVIVNGMLKTGRYEVTVDGNTLPSGVYLYTLVAKGTGEFDGEYQKTRKLLLMK